MSVPRVAGTDILDRGVADDAVACVSPVSTVNLKIPTHIRFSLTSPLIVARKRDSDESPLDCVFFASSSLPCPFFFPQNLWWNMPIR